MGWQVETTRLEGYAGAENVPVTNESHQAEVYAEVVHRAACDPDIAQVNIFGFRDDVARTGFQAGLHRVDGTGRPAAHAVRAALLEPRACTASAWRPARAVLGARRPRVVVAGTQLAVRLTAAEGAIARACLLPGTHSLAAARRALASRQAPVGGCARSPVLANRVTTLRLRRPQQAHTLAVRLSAETNPSRTTTLVRLVR
jgi:hypothetical protein